MADTSIEWTSKVWNPIRGCSRVSAGCDNCYAMRMAHRHSGPGRPYEGLTTIRRGKVDWLGVSRFVPEQLRVPMRWRKPARIFVNSMSDLFHQSLTDDEIAAVFGVMAACPQHTFQILTKRPKRMLEWFSRDDDHATWCGEEAARATGDSFASFSFGAGGQWPLKNAWLGVSVENQEQADKRIPLLLECPAAIRWISAEPLLGPLDIEPYLNEPLDPAPPGKENSKLDWVVVGGESGNGARPFDLSWARNIVHDCQEAGVPCFVKQLGKDPVDANNEQRVNLANTKGSDPSEWEQYLRVRQFPGVTS